MKINVKGPIRDLLAFRNLVPGRQKRFAQAPAQPLGPAPMNKLAQHLHPERQHLVIAGIKDETKTTKTFKLVPDPDASTQELAYFRAGQYLSLKVDVDGVRITRPYSIASAPYQALGDDGFYEITLRRKEDGFLTPHVWKTWTVGTRVKSSGPCGEFYYEPLRDAPTIVALAGGSGITPFISMAREIVHGDLDAKMMLLYGSSDEDDIVYYDTLKTLEAQSAGKVKVVHVLSCEETSLEGCELGFITVDIIKAYSNVANSSFFICGPQAMYTFVAQELATLDLPPRRVRWEVSGGVDDATRTPGFPQNVKDRVFQLEVHIGGLTTEIPAKATETVLVALERANLAPPSQCRSGECGFCRARLMSGEVYIPAESDGRRAADKQFGYIHPCVAYPLTDLELAVPRDV
jgi:ferredoxin-NADP reductase